MSIDIALNHVTHYTYDQLIKLGPQTVRLRPAPHTRTPILSYSLKVTPSDHFVNWQQDPHSNYQARFVFPKPTRQFKVEVDLVARLSVINPFDFFLEPSADQSPFTYEEGLKHDLLPFLKAQKQGPLFEQFLKAFDMKPRSTIDFVMDLTRAVQSAVGYIVRLEPGVQACEETLKLKTGSCRDSAWLMVQLLRHMGFAARFVSGYLIQLKPDVKSLDGPSGTEQDFTDLHAWAEVYLPGAGWVGLDATSGMAATEGHIPLACTPEPITAAPITGALDPCESTMQHTMSITRVHEQRRVTQPFTEEQWDQLNAIGVKVDQQLKKNNIQLSMGGEPTFVSIDDMDGAQWKTDALGKEKFELACELLHRLQKVWAPGALLSYEQGKWYPGEPLPRWALCCYWREDGEPVWKDLSLLAPLDKEGPLKAEDAHTFIEALAGELQVNPEHVVCGYEDGWHYRWKAGHLPENLDPFDAKLSDPLENKRLNRLFSEGIEKPVGYTLPLKNAAQDSQVQWSSGPWCFKTERMYLLPGDSPMGLRLPLDQLPWEPAGKRQKLYDQDTMSVRPELKKKPSAKSAAVIEGDSIVRTALCVEVREGRLCVFLPPLETLEAYLQLIESIEVTAKNCLMPVLIEGYAPPRDTRVHVLKITPDPGVIEVNVPPVRTWDQMVHQTRTLYEQARQTRLGAEKFMLDGKHTGTGGGNHMVLGGVTPSESPLLKRPDLLASFVAYWNNHPALSYLFSGMFIGPTSQAPRVDEGRRDSVYELELAIRELNKLEEKPPWMVDRLFRNLLVDLTGNTHRAEFCMDKLFSPDSSTGRLGLLELRAFEMPPHADMSLAQQLLLRTLLAWFWEQPYEQPLTRWSTAIHDKWMLPHFVWQDFRAVLLDLNQAGYAFNAEHFEAQAAFRFPFIGSIEHEGITVELREAIEPWYVLGEEPAGGGTSRFVDSSVERLQVKVNGASGNRYQITCNQRMLPLHATGVPGEFVCGVRYRAWQPPSCLHPTIPVHVPLVFDIMDTESKHSLGGCVYHVAHPGGRNYETFPVNAYEAESRRMARFSAMGHTPGQVASLKQETQNPDFPLTLDLRR